MKFVFSIFLLSFLILACSDKLDKPTSHSFLIPWPDNSGQYSLQIVDLKTLEDPRKVRGAAAKMWIHPRLENNQLSGEAPNATYAEGKGYWVPKHVQSQELVAVYAHFERLMKLDSDLGVKELLTWPRPVGIQFLGIDPRDNRQIFENAMYEPVSDSTIFFPYRRRHFMSVSRNAGVIAHEHFHALFHAMVLKPIQIKYGVNSFGLSEGKIDLSKPMSEEQIKKAQILRTNLYLLRAMNEGFADVWGYLYSGQKTFINFSLDHPQRSLAEPKIKRDFKNFIPRSIEILDSRILESEAYSLGTAYARWVVYRLELEKNKLKSLDIDTTNNRLLQSRLIEWLEAFAKIFLEDFDKGIQIDSWFSTIFSDAALDKESCANLAEVSSSRLLIPSCESIINED